MWNNIILCVLKFPISPQAQLKCIGNFCYLINTFILYRVNLIMKNFNVKKINKLNVLYLYYVYVDNIRNCTECMIKYQIWFKFKNVFPSRICLHHIKIFLSQGYCLFRTLLNLALRLTDVWCPGTHNLWTSKHDEWGLVIINYFYILFLFTQKDDDPRKHICFFFEVSQTRHTLQLMIGVRLPRQRSRFALLNFATSSSRRSNNNSSSDATERAEEIK